MEKYDSRYKRDSFPLIVGLGLIALNIYFYNSEDLAKEDLAVPIVGSLALRIPLVFWIHSISNRLNRQGYWEIFCFFLPALALILIYFQKKIRLGFKDYARIHPSVQKDYEADIVLIENGYYDELLDEKQANSAFKDVLLKYLKISDTFYNEKAKVEKSKILMQLESLKEKGFLTKEEFEVKIKTLQD